MKRYLSHVVLSIALSFSFGCSTPPPPQPETDLSSSVPALRPITTITETDSTWENENFRIKENKPLLGKESLTFSILNTNATAIDLFDFSACVYRRVIHGKLSRGTPLNPSERSLLKFCFETQLLTISMLSDVMRADLSHRKPIFTTPVTQTDLSSSQLSKDSIYDVTTITSLQNNFVSSKDPLRIGIKHWSSCFLGRNEIYVLDVGNTLSPHIDAMDKEIRSEFYNLINENAPVTCFKPYTTPYSRSSKSEMPFIVTSRWNDLVNYTDRYINDYRQIIQDINAARRLTEDTAWKSAIDRYSLNISPIASHIIRKYRYTYYDIPFLTSCNIALCDIKKNWHWWHNDYDGMTSVLHIFYESIGGTRMISKIASQNSAIAQAHLIEYAKDVMEDKFTTLQTATRLYEVNLGAKDDPFSDNDLERVGR